jgi:hypothetical protein
MHRNRESFGHTVQQKSEPSQAGPKWFLNADCIFYRPPNLTELS